MMKRYFIQALSLLILVTALSGCRKNVQDGVLHQGGEVTQAQLLQNPQYVKGYLDDTYNTLQYRYTSLGDGALLASASDEAVHSNVNSLIYTLIDGTWSPSKTFDDAYANYYNGIRRTNIFLATISKGEILGLNSTLTPAVLRQRFRGEAYFLRAMFEFELVKRYGAIVLTTTPLAATDNLNLPRNTFDECVKQITMDCDSATNLLPQWNTDYNASTDTKEIGRATQVAAMSLKARMLLYAASPLNNPSGDVTKWQAAADAALLVINLGKAQLITPYANIFNYSTGAYNNEVIFATQAVNTDSVEYYNAPISYTGALGRTNPTQEMVDAFEMSNGKLITDATSGYDPTNPYINRDPRFALDILYNGAIFKSVAVQTFPGGRDGIGATINATRTGYYMNKFLSQNATWGLVSNTSVRHPWVLIRYAEVLLDYAEALNEAQGPVNDVYTKVNLVRSRVLMPGLPAGLSQAGMRARIHNERRVELCFEDHRFYDVRRWNEAVTTFSQPATGMSIVVNAANVPTAYNRFTVQTRVFTSKDNLFPIPQGQINLEPALKQNPNW